MTLSFHIRHEVTPDRSWEVLSAIASALPYDHITQSERQETRLRQLGLLGGTVLSDDGRTIAQICEKTPAIWGDLTHYLHYSLWNPAYPLVNGLSYTYRHFADYLWEIGSVSLTESFWDPVVGFLIGEAEADPSFAGEVSAATRQGTVSLSKFSLVGATHWFRALVPTVIDEDRFSRRHFCPPELMLLALGWVAQTLGGDIGIDFLLTPDRRASLCRVCLLDPVALDRVLDWTLPLYSGIIRPGTGAGVYGRFVRFLKWPELQDLLR